MEVLNNCALENLEPARAKETRKLLLTAESNLISCHENKFGLPVIKGTSFCFALLSLHSLNRSSPNTK
jgi:hypothetical protein